MQRLEELKVLYFEVVDEVVQQFLLELFMISHYINDCVVLLYIIT